MRVLILFAAIALPGCEADISQQPCTKRFAEMTRAVPDGELASILTYDITSRPKDYSRALLK